MTGRCGGRSPRSENTLEALRDLVKRDSQQDVSGLAYVEFDVHVRPRLPCHACSSASFQHAAQMSALMEMLSLLYIAGTRMLKPPCCHHDAQSVREQPKSAPTDLSNPSLTLEHCNRNFNSKKFLSKLLDHCFTCSGSSLVLTPVPRPRQETKDGEIVVFHDDTLARAVDGAGLNAAPAAALLAEAGLDFRTATIQQMTHAQLRSFHLGGHPGVHIPSLRDFLRRAPFRKTFSCARSP